MIANGLILPTERPLRTNDIKRALLTYDRVYLMSPSDRDVIKREHFMGIVANFPIDMPTASVRVLGKVRGYDDAFQRALDESAPAVQQGLIHVIDAPPPERPILQPFDFFRPVVVTGPSGMLSKAVYDTYRHTATDPEFIGAISRGMEDLVVGGLGLTDELAPQGLEDFPAAASYGPAPLPYPGPVESAAAREVLNRLCHARIGSTIKSLAVCDARQLSPVTSDKGVAAFIGRLNANVNSALTMASGSDERRLEILGLRELHDVVIAEFVDQSMLTALSVADVVRMRTSAWGKARENRAHLAETLVLLAHEEPDAAKLRDRFRHALHEHAEARSDWNDEQKKLIAKVVCDLVEKSLVGAALFDKIMSLGTIGAVLAVGAFGANWARENLPQLMDFVNARKSIKGLPGYALVQPYAPFLA